MNRHEFRITNDSAGLITEDQRSFFGPIIWAISLSRPYRKLVTVILLAMLLETIIGLATPWPLKIIIDNVVGHHALPSWLAMDGFLFSCRKKNATGGCCSN